MSAAQIDLIEKVFKAGKQHACDGAVTHAGQQPDILGIEGLTELSADLVGACHIDVSNLGEGGDRHGLVVQFA